MAVTFEPRGRLVEIRFASVPTARELEGLKASLTSHARKLGGKVAILATIESGGLGTLAPDARQVFIDEWRSLIGFVAAAAVVIQGEGVLSMVTRGFVRTLGLALGRAWTVHSERREAATALAERMGVPAETWVTAAGA